MPKPSDALLNGTRYQASNFTFRVYGLLLKGIGQIDWGVTTDPAKVMGLARESIGETEGNVQYTASFTMFRAEYDYLSESSPIPLQDRPGDIVINYAARGQPSKNVHIRINGLTEAKTSVAGGSTDATSVPVVCRVMFIKENGRALVSNSIF